MQKLALNRKDDGGVVGYIYLDLAARQGKAAGAVHYTISAARRLEEPEEAQLPSVALCCSFAQPVSASVSFMTHQELEVRSPFPTGVPPVLGYVVL